MARMVPDRFGPMASYQLAEFIIYEQLAKLPDQYYVWHSRVMDKVRKDGTQYIGESDFIVYHPQKGLLLLEVKGGKVFADGEGKFFSESRGGSVHPIKDPFIQAGSNLFDLVNKFEKVQNYKLKACTYGVCLPQTLIDHKQTSISVNRARLIDHQALAKDKFQEWVKALFEMIAISDRVLPENIKLYLKKFLDNNISMEFSIKSMIDAQQREISKINYCQDVIVDMFKDKNRAAFQGSAGTGKTWVAMKKAVDLADQDKKVLFLCYNNNLKDAIQHTLGQDKSRNIHVYTFHSYLNSKMKNILMDIVDSRDAGDDYIALMAELYELNGREKEIGTPNITHATSETVDLFSYENILNKYRDRLPAIIPDILELFKSADKVNYWSLDFPAAFQKLLSQLKQEDSEWSRLLAKVQYDAVLIDEAQDFHELWVDIIKDMYQDYRKRIIYIFYDDNQNIFQKKNQLPILSLISNWGDKEHFIYRLRDNVRNTPAIFKYIKTKTGLGKTSHSLVAQGGRDPESSQGQLKELHKFIIEKIRTLVDKHNISYNDIVLLSNRSVPKIEGLEDLFHKAGVKIGEYQGPEDRDYLAWSTIQSFKGLESNIVFYIDVKGAGEQDNIATELSYIGMTRAKFLLYVFEMEGLWIKQFPENMF